MTTDAIATAVQDASDTPATAVPGEEEEPASAEFEGESLEEAQEAQAEARGWLDAQASSEESQARQDAQALESPTKESLRSTEASFLSATPRPLRVRDTPGGKSQVVLEGDGEGDNTYET